MVAWIEPDGVVDRTPPFRRLLVANRGEIAVRVFRTCARLGVETVAVVAPDDAGALHARVADRAVPVGGYLDPEELVRSAVGSGADAVHPGYGFLAERPELAEAVERAGLAWVGPPAAVLRLGGDKLEAKRIAAEAGVPTLPTGAPGEIGFPLLVKATAGGGGRGMRIVRDAAELDGALAAAAREAEAAFGDGTVFCERLLPRPRHVEVQLLGHDRGVCVLGTRDCSVQRRHQKIVEEAPAPFLPLLLVQRVESAARAFAEAIEYRSAGTAEFLVDGDDAFFLELNGRIQVEHTVTEELTGLDLVELQLRVAAGDRVDVRPAPRGHAVQARLYAEDPVTLLPQSGRIEELRFADGIRVDAGVEAGDEVGVSYDPLIAKLVARGHDRDDALDRLSEALAATRVGGVTTNLPFLSWLVDHPAFRAGRLSTAFLLDHPPLAPAPLRLPRGTWATPWRLNLPAPLPAAPPQAVPAAGDHHLHGATASVSAPMPGTVVAVDVRVGDAVEPRQALLRLEAMKMEVPVAAPFPAEVEAIEVAAGDRVAAGDLLVVLAPR